MEPALTSEEDPGSCPPAIRPPDPDTSESEHRLPSVELLEEKLHSCQVQTEEDKFFIPRGTLEDALNLETVRLAIEDSLPGLTKDGAARYAKEICCQEPSFRKIFAVLVLSDMIDSIVRFMDLGVDDSCLPMPDPRSSKSYDSPHSPGAIEKNHGGRRIEWNRIFKRRWSRRLNFFRSQWIVLSPIFRSANQIEHFSFNHEHIMPFLDARSGASTDSKSDVDNVELGQARYGGYSEVRSVKIHPAHDDFSDYGISNPGHLFALKRLNTHDDRELWQEVDILKRFRNVDHIIQLLATFEVNEGSLSSYYLLFPWATGDLELLWEAKHSYVGDYRIAPWIAKQCYGLARALSSIHNDDDDHNPVDTDHLYGRHGDIKPSNILWFSPSPSEINVDFGQLVMGDFGLGDFRSDHSRSGLDASAFARSPKYRAPEFDIGGRNISRKVDIWTLGCTHLEFVTWYLMGNEAVTDKFREARSEPDIYGIYADTFFRIVGGDNGSVGIIKPQATAWITSLHEHRSCSDYIHDFLELIEHHMLVADPKGRLTAAALSGKMKEMYSRCQDNPQYYQVGKPRPGNAQPEESVSCHVISGSGDATGNIQRKKGNIMTMVRNVLRHSKASDRNVP